MLGERNAVMMRAHGVTTAFPEVRSATVAACYLEESAALQLRMLAAAGGDASRIRGQSDETAAALELAFDRTWRADEAFFKPRVSWLSVTDCYLCNRILAGHPIRGKTRIGKNPAHTLNRF